MSRYPQEAAAWRGIQPSLSGWLMLAPCSTRKVTMSTLSSMHAWEREREKGSKATIRSKERDLPCVSICVYLHACLYMHTCIWAYVSGMACVIVTNSLHGQRIALRVIDCHVHPELLGNFGSRSIPKMPAHSRGVWNTTKHSTADGGIEVLCLYVPTLFKKVRDLF